MARIGIFGGSFNPVHTGHLILAERVCSERSLDKVLFVPVLYPPHKPAKPLASAEHRMRMLGLALDGNPAFEALPLELNREEPSYTLITIRELRKDMGPSAELFLVLGGDSVHDIPNWWHAGELVREVEIIAFDRPGYPVQEAVGGMGELFGRAWVDRVRELKVDAPLLDISATDIRERVSAGKSIRYMVPEPVRQYILRHGLYAES